MKKTRKFTTLTLSGIIAISSVGLLSSVKEVDEKLHKAEHITKYILSQSTEPVGGVVTARYLMGLDESEDYILAVGSEGGYAIYDTEMELIEFSETGSSPYSGIVDTDSYYAGPSNYYRKQGEEAVNLHTKEKVKKDSKKELAGKVKNKIKESKEERKRRKEEDKQTKKEEKTTDQTNDEEIVYADPGPTGGGEIRIDSYEVMERKYISNQQFFFESTDYGDNRGATCTSVAVQLLLTYNNWANDGRLITHPDFLYERTPEILAQPYHPNMIRTTSIYDRDDGITTFYEQLIAYIDPLENGTWELEAYFGIERYLQVYVEETVSDLIDINVCADKQKVCSVIRQELEADRPSLVGITSYQLKDDGTLKTGGHSIVVYGSQTFNVEGEAVEGFIAHFGWLESPTALWVNSAWVNDCLTFETTHTHTDVGFSAQNHIVQCTECGRTAHTNLHVYKECMFIVDGEDFHETRHTGICFCGYEEEISHQFYYECYDYIHHYKKCKCGYFRLETHWSKYGSDCFECGDELNN